MMQLSDLARAIHVGDHLGTASARGEAGSPARVHAEQSQPGQVTESFESSHLCPLRGLGENAEGNHSLPCVW